MSLHFVAADVMKPACVNETTGKIRNELLKRLNYLIPVMNYLMYFPFFALVNFAEQ